MRPTKALVNLARLEDNIRNLKSLTPPGTAFMAVIKANAYGHGMDAVAHCAISSGASWLGVALPEEGAALREKGINAPILILGEIDEEQCETVLNYNLTQAIPSLSTAFILNKTAEKAGKMINIHLKLDTGMGRIGFRSLEELKAVLSELKTLKSLNVDGVFTHFAVADGIFKHSAEEDGIFTHSAKEDGEDVSFTLKQIESFDNMIQVIKQFGFRPKYTHASNSAGIINFPNAHYNMVRGGISMYGYYPSNNTNHTKIPLLPVLQWETKVVHVKFINIGDSISYGRTFIASSQRKVATLPVGYADGYNRLLGNKAYVLIHNMRAPVIGRVCMDQIMIDVTDIPDVSPGDQAILIGEQGTESISADELADICGTISYEILTSISDRVPRVYIE